MWLCCSTFVFIFSLGFSIHPQGNWIPFIGLLLISFEITRDMNSKPCFLLPSRGFRAHPFPPCLHLFPSSLCHFLSFCSWMSSPLLPVLIVLLQEAWDCRVQTTLSALSRKGGAASACTINSNIICHRSYSMKTYRKEHDQESKTS